MTTLTTRRLTLRPPLASDAAALVRALDNPNVSRWTGRIPHPYGPEDAEAFFTHCQTRPADALILFIIRDCALIGGIENGELGYWLAETAWRQGYGREAAQAVVDHAFQGLGRHVVTASYITANAASQRILEGLNFMKTGTGTRFSQARRDQVSITSLELTRARWQDMKERQR